MMQYPLFAVAPQPPATVVGVFSTIFVHCSSLIQED